MTKRNEEDFKDLVKSRPLGLKEFPIFNMPSKTGMKIIEPFIMSDVNTLMLNKTYQRIIHPEKVRELVKSIDEYGYWPDSIITLNQKREIINGQQRYMACLQLRIKEVPTTIISFPTLRQEEEYFEKSNNWNTHLDQFSLWDARYQADHPYALLLYRLKDDPGSLLYERIPVKGDKKGDNKLTMSIALFLIQASFGYSTKWDRARDSTITGKLENGGFDYNTTLKKINSMLDFISDWVGKDKKSNPIAYTMSNFEAIANFYTRLVKEEKITTGKDREKVVRKMRTFEFDRGFSRMMQSEKRDAFKEFFNNGLPVEDRI